MGELLMRRYLSGTSITVSSAGTHALVGHPIDPSSGRLMDSVGIDSGEFRSRQLTRELAENADLILCFEEEQRNNIVDMAPAVVRRTFLVTDFANMCLYCAQHDLVKGLTVQERLNSVIEASSFIRPMIPAPRDVEDPFTKDFPVFRKAANQTNKAIWIILNSMLQALPSEWCAGSNHDRAMRRKHSRLLRNPLLRNLWRFRCRCLRLTSPMLRRPK